MKRGPTDEGSPAILTGRKDRPAGSPRQVLDALAAELGRLAAERDYARVAIEDKAKPDGLSSPTGESVQ
jgi:hypothetical protein